ncbi:MAG: hypothetical protein M1464_06290, partial [Candidatus Thermoplasmatota archaeon]|nr:hypothetical protein [Candidatus Thermoplasmatota archaeon]
MNKIIPALIMIVLIAPGLAVMATAGSSSNQLTQPQVERFPGSTESNSTLQLFSSVPDIAFPYLKGLSGGMITATTSYGFMEEITFPSNDGSAIAKD